MPAPSRRRRREGRHVLGEERLQSFHLAVLRGGEETPGKLRTFHR
jgi:hypothetical protein